MILRSITGYSCTKWIALLLVLLPLVWPATRLAEVSGRDEVSRACQDGDTPPTPAADQFALQATGNARYLAVEWTQAPPDALDLSSLTYRGPPTH